MKESSKITKMKKSSRMKTIFTFGLTTMLLSYFFISIGNHSWNPMKFHYESTYWFGALTFLGFIAGALVVVLELDKPIHNPHNF